MPGAGRAGAGEPGRGGEREGEERPRVLSHRLPIPGGAVAVPRAPAAQGAPRDEHRRCPEQGGCPGPRRGSAPVCGWLLVPTRSWGKPRVTCPALCARAQGLELGFPLAARFSMQPSPNLTLLAWLLARGNAKRVVK